jgi:acyl carrier protein
MTVVLGKCAVEATFGGAGMAVTVYARLKHLIVEQLGVDDEDVVPSASFIDDLNADSLELVELCAAIEEQYGIEIPDEDASRLQTVQDAVDYLEERIG